MPTHLEQELEAIKAKVYEMEDLAIEAIVNAVDALKTQDTRLAEKVIQGDTVIDRLEVEIDEECARIMVTKQPAAVHLRFVLALLKINTDLERIGDLATSIAREVIRIGDRPHVKPLIDIPRMADLAIGMIKSSFESIANKNVSQAKSIIREDEEIDKLNMQIYRELFSFMVENPRNVSEALGLIMVAKSLERIGDHATNIAERAVYYIEGVDIRHNEGQS